MTKYWEEQMNHEPTRVYYEELLKILEIYKPKRVLEIGTGWGISGSAFLNSGVKELITIDPNINEVYGAKAKEELESKSNGRVTYIQGRTPQVLGHLIHQGEKFDMIYIDGDHGFKAVQSDLSLADKLLNENGRIVLDDFLHRKNFDGDYGITKAVADYLSKEKRTAKIFQVYPTNNNAFLVI